MAEEAAKTQDGMAECHDAVMAEEPSVSQDDEVMAEEFSKTQDFQNIQIQETRSFVSAMSLDLGSDDDTMEDGAVYNSAFDIQILKGSIENGQSALDQVTGKDVVLVLGKTGTGKSTFIQAIAGKRIKEVEYVMLVDGKNDIYRVYEAENPLQGSEIGHNKLSMTKAINSIERTTSKGSTLTYVDTPGFADTDGHEMDIATSIMLTEIAKRCKSLRFVVLINYVSLLEDRGGALSAVLKFIGAFVKNFEKDKKSFMFLFSHTNVIKDIQTLSDAKHHILREITKMLEVMKDVHVRSVLKYIKQSFSKGYSYVDVIDPTKTNFGSIMKFIEVSIKTVGNQTISTNCGLTMTSKLLLTGEIQKLALELQEHLKSPTKNIIRVTEISDILSYLASQIAMTEIKDASLRSTIAIQNFRHETRVFIETQIVLATNLEKSFRDSNKKDLFRAMASYSSFSDSSILMERLIQGLTGLQQESFKHTGAESFDFTVYTLMRLQIFQNESPRFDCLYTETMQHFKNVLTQINQDFLNFQHDHKIFQKDNICNLATKLALINSLHPFVDELAKLALCVYEVVQSSTNVVNAFLQLISSWEREIMQLEKGDISNEDLRQVRDFGYNLNILHCCIQPQLLKDKVHEATDLFESQVLGFYENVASSYERLAADIDKIRILKEIADDVISFEHINLKPLAFKMNEIVLRHRSTINMLEKEINIHLQSFAQSGFESCDQIEKLLKSFDEHVWFDDLLEEEKRFVHNVSIALRASCSKMVQRIYDQVGSQLSLMIESPFETGHLDCFNSLLSKFYEADRFSIRMLSNEKSLTKDAESLRSNLQRYMEALKDSANQAVQDWNKLMEQEEVDSRQITMETRKINEVLVILNKLGDPTVPSSIMESVRDLRSSIESQLKMFSVQVDDCFCTEEADFVLMERFLLCVSAFGEYEFTKIHLPNLHELTNKATIITSAIATVIEDKVESTTCWDDIQKLLGKLEGAQIVDKYTNGQAQSRLGPLHKLLRNKASEVDAAIEAMMENKNFIGIAELIAPLKVSKDQLKRQKFNFYQEKICKHFQNLIHCTSRSVGAMTQETSHNVLEWFNSLGNAEAELIECMRPKLDLKTTLQKLKERLNKEIRKIVDKFFRAAGKLSDFAEMAILHSDIEHLGSLFENYLHEPTKTSIKTVDDLYRRKITSVATEMEHYFTKQVEGSTFLLILNGLHSAVESNHKATNELSSVYWTTISEAMARLTVLLGDLSREVAENMCFGQGVAVLSRILLELDQGFDKHFAIEKLPYDCQQKLETWKKKLQECERELDLTSVPRREERLKALCTKLTCMKNMKQSWFRWGQWGHEKDYENFCEKLGHEVETVFVQGSNALRNKDFSQTRDAVETLGSVTKVLVHHAPSSNQLLQRLKSEAEHHFKDIAQQAREYLSAHENDHFMNFFPDIKACIRYLPFVLETTEHEFVLLNQLVHSKLSSQVRRVKELLAMESNDNMDFARVRVEVEMARTFGNFVADNYPLFQEEIKPLFREEIKGSARETALKWLDEIVKICHVHFHNGRNLSKIKYYAILGIVPSAGHEKIRHAYKAKARKWHPDKKVNTGNIFLKIKDAHDVLLQEQEPSCLKKPFDQDIASIQEALRKKVSILLREKRYDGVESLLFMLPSISRLEDLVSPNLSWKEIQAGVEDVIENHVKNLQNNIEDSWISRRYRDLNDFIDDLEDMEKHVISHPRNVSWKSAIREKIDEEINKLGRTARGFLSTREVAEANRTEFRGCIIGMGGVLIDLQHFKSSTRNVMSDVFESCLANAWGFAYLFELGLSLRRNGDDSAEDTRVAYSIISEFSHFKEVETMTWNHETTQKPAEDTVLGIVSRHALSQLPMPIDRPTLLESFSKFECDYRSLLGQYLQPEANRQTLIEDTIDICKKVKPVRCCDGWGNEVKAVVPRVLAGVFALFTVCKSGDSFHRLERSEKAASLGEQVLMKPHNIQVMTLLYMFGCDNVESKSLESQLLRIRTGEGKSMILGAAATVLGLFGFDVRCV